MLNFRCLLKKKVKFLNFAFFNRSTYTTSHGVHSPYEILGVSPSASLADIKKAYHSLSKIYHPDKNSSKEAIEKFKVINNAYNTLKEYHGEHSSFHSHHGSSPFSRKNNGPHPTNSRNHETHKTKTQEETLYEEIFGKSYSSDPMYFYMSENAEKRRNFEEKLRNMRKKERESTAGFDENNFRGGYHNYRDYKADSSDYEFKITDEFTLLIGFVGFSVAVLFLLSSTKSRNQSAVESEHQKEMERMVEKFREKELKRSRDLLEKSKENYLRSLPKMKKYPTLEEPWAENLLVDYTIYPDIKLYSVSHRYFYEETDPTQFTSSHSFEKTKLRNVKLNTAITLSLETERMLKNTFVNVEFLEKTLKEQGHWEPPGFFTRFFGFIYVKLRKMPILVENLRAETEWISLFDLYIKYNSPLPYVHEDFYEFKVESQKLGWLGNVTLNHRRIPKIYLTGSEKNVFFWRGSKPLLHPESRYIHIWDNFYTTSKEDYK